MEGGLWMSLVEGDYTGRQGLGDERRSPAGREGSSPSSTR